MEQWVVPVLSLVGGGAGAYLGMRMAITRLETQMIDARDEIRELRRRTHDHTNALLKLDGRVTALEDREDQR